ncbi:MAG: glycerophosphodiester phosphodiesterase [Candidatus Cloacimonadota bacterium]|nr:MAG: glycerophosphodiester phosphodiesterase [Candidatus Cloacimonadota bacterium]
MKKITSFIGIFSILFSLNNAFAESPFIEIHGHRGARSILPENTLPAIKYALEVGVDVLEFDLAVTKDDYLVLSHNPQISGDICKDKYGNSLPKKGKFINKMTLREVQSYDCGVLQNPRFKNQKTIKGTKIPTLDEVFEMLRKNKHKNAQKIWFNIETKIYKDHPEYTVSPKKFAKLLYLSLKKNQVRHRTVVQSFDYRTLIRMRLLDPSIKISALIAKARPSFTAIAKGLNPDYISPKATLLTSDNISMAHFYGMKVVPWTINKKEDWDKYIMMGVDGIITDDPKPLVDYMTSLQLR